MHKFLLAAAALAFAAGAAHAQTVRLGTEGAYPPYNFINDNNEVDGFERELGDALCDRAGLTCEWVVNDWDTIIPNLVGGNYDVIIAGMSITEARAQVIAFSENYLPSEPSAYMALAGAGESVISGVVAAQSNTIQASHVASTAATLVEFPTPDETIAAVRNGEADAVLADRGFLAPIADESGGQLALVGEPLYIGGGIGLGLRQSDTELRAKLDAAIQGMKADGSLNALITKWFKDEFPLF